MEKVILLTDFYFPRNNANGLCIGRIGYGLKKMNVEVHVVSYQDQGASNEDIIDGIFIHRVKPAFFYTLRSFYYAHSTEFVGRFVWAIALCHRRLSKLLFSYWYPLAYPLSLKRYIDKVKEISITTGCKNIVAGYNPIEAIAACLVFSEKRGYKTVAYFMDTFTLTANAKKYSFIFNRGRWWEKKVFNASSLIANLPLYKHHYEKTWYDAWHYKMIYIDIPVNFEEAESIQKKGENEQLVFLYTGAASFNDRDPRYFIEIFDEYHKKHLSSVHFYGKNDIGGYLEKCHEQNYDIVNHGFVSFDVLQKARKNADILVNIGSPNEIIVPSRLIEHISTGKPIVHFYCRNDDPCLYYLNRYPLSIIIDMRDDFSTNIEKFMEFCNHSRGKSLGKTFLENSYPENSVSAISKKLCDVFGIGKNN